MVIIVVRLNCVKSIICGHHSILGEKKSKEIRRRRTIDDQIDNYTALGYLNLMFVDKASCMD